MEKSHPAYKGDEPFVFVCYSHSDSAQVHQEMQRMRRQGINIWYDEGIAVGASWSQEIADALDGASHFVFIATPNSVSSRHCLNEIQYALSHNKRLVSIHLQDLEMPTGMELSLGASQALMKYQYTDEVYEEKLREALTKSFTPRMSAPHGRSRRRWGILFAACLVGAIALAGAFIMQRSPAPLSKEGSFAVLPFKNNSTAAQEYIADGLTDGLITQLSKLEDIYVTSRASSFALKQNLRLGSIGMPGIRERLRVRYVIDGSLRPNADSSGLVVNVQIIDADQDTNVWSGEWDTAKETIMNIQSEIARQARQIVSPDLDMDLVSIAAPVTESSVAYDKYMQGRNALRQPRTQELQDQAETFLKDSVNLDGEFAQAHAGLCEVYLGNFSANQDPLQFVLAQKACNQALQIDPQLWEVSLSLGRLYRASGDYAQSLIELDRAASLEPADAGIMIQRGWTLNEMGQLAQAESSFVKAVSLEPGYWRTYTSLAGYYYDHVQYDKALTAYQQAVGLVSEDSSIRHNIATIQLALGSFESAAQTYHDLIDQNPVPLISTVSNLGTAYYNMGCYEEAATYQKQAVQLAPNKHSLLGRLAESCRFVNGGEAFAKHTWTQAAALAGASQNQSDWITKGLLAIYQAHLGQADQAAENIERMWQLNPEDSIAHFYAAIVAKKAGDEETARSARASSLAKGFPDVMMQRDPDLNDGLSCLLKKRLAYAPETCQMR